MSKQNSLRYAQLILRSFLITLILLGVNLSAAAAQTINPQATRPLLRLDQVDAEVKCNDYTTFDSNHFTNSVVINNQWLPIIPGMQYTLEGRANRTGQILPHQVTFTVTDLTKIINGVRTLVVWDVDVNNKVLEEAELAFFAQDNDGNIWGLGEYPEEYKKGKFTGAPSTWIHGIDQAKGGVAMPADPHLGMPSYSQGFVEKIGFYDCGQPFASGEKLCIELGCYENVLIIDEWSPLDPASGHQRKYYAPNVGNINITAVNDPEAETLVMIKRKRLTYDELVQASNEALKLDQHGYQVSKVYSQTLPMVAMPELVTYQMTSQSAGNGSVILDPPGGVYSATTPIQLNAVPDVGFTFVGWSGTITGTTNPITVSMTADQVVTATFAAAPIVTHTITVNTVNSGTVLLNPPGGVYTDGTIVQLQALPDAGFVFDGWSGAVTGTTNPMSLSVTADSVVTATFVTEPVQSYHLTVTVVGTGTVTLNPPGGVYPAGTEVLVTATAGTGVEFTGWEGAVSDIANPITVTVKADMTITAKFTGVSVQEPKVFLPWVLRN